MVSLGLFWENATRYFSRFLGLIFLTGLIGIGVSVVSMILMYMPFIPYYFIERFETNIRPIM